MNETSYPRVYGGLNGTDWQRQELDNQTARLISNQTISESAVSGYATFLNPATFGVDVSFKITDVTGVKSITLLRSVSADIATAVVLQTWTATVASFAWSDTDKVIHQVPFVNYWIRLEPESINGTPVVVGPESALLNPQLIAPQPATEISVAHDAAKNGAVTVCANVAGVPVNGSVKIYVSGYQGVTGFVAIAQQAQAPLKFTMQQTGETVTLKAIGVSSGETESASGPTTTLVLSNTATIPAKPEGVVASTTATGNQINFPASLDAGITTYQIWQTMRVGGSFGVATNIGSVSPGTGTLSYLDTTGLTNDFQYYVVAVNPAGSSLPSNPAVPNVIYGSGQLPPNVPINVTNTAIITSADLIGSVLVSIDGPGGAGTAYTKIAGNGSPSRPNGTVQPLSYATFYYIVYTGTAYIATTSYPATLPDGYEFVGSITTRGPSSATGTGATATAVIDGSGHVIQINVTAGGSAYAAATVSISGGAGSGAQATATISGGALSTVTVTNGGTGYTTAPTVTIVPGVSGGTTGGGGSAGSPHGGRNGGWSPL